MAHYLVSTFEIQVGLNQSETRRMSQGMFSNSEATLLEIFPKYLRVEATTLLVEVNKPGGGRTGRGS